jgi:hypothetical protein
LNTVVVAVGIAILLFELIAIHASQALQDTIADQAGIGASHTGKILGKAVRCQRTLVIAKISRSIIIRHLVATAEKTQDEVVEPEEWIGGPRSSFEGVWTAEDHSEIKCRGGLNPERS